VLGAAVAVPHTGGCRDGLLEDRVSENQGAESTLAYLTAIAELRLVEAPLVASEPAVSPGSGAVLPRETCSL
jgi:hypothetical protein